MVFTLLGAKNSREGCFLDKNTRNRRGFAQEAASWLSRITTSALSSSLRKTPRRLCLQHRDGDERFDGIFQPARSSANQFRGFFFHDQIARASSILRLEFFHETNRVAANLISKWDSISSPRYRLRSLLRLIVSLYARIEKVVQDGADSRSELQTFVGTSKREQTPERLRLPCSATPHLAPVR